MNASESLAFVKSQKAYHARQASRQDILPGKAERHEELINAFSDLEDLLAQRGSRDEPRSTPTVIPGRLRLGDISDLPPSLKAELNVSEADQAETQILEVIGSFDGFAAVDEILVGLWRKFKVETKRRTLASKLYRMTKKRLIHSVPKRRGFYSLTPINGSATERSGLD
jgi:hypothetical protein